MGEIRLLDNLHHGAAVVSADGKDVGKLHAVVVDPRDNEVTHIVVNAGPFFPEPGFGAPRLVNVPIEEMADASEKRVLLKCTRQRFEELPEYAERSFTPPIQRPGEPPQEGPAQLLWNVGAALAASFSNLLTGIAVPAERFRRATFERHIMHGAPVWRKEPHTYIGHVDRVLVDEETDEIEALVISRGGFFHEDVILPAEYITEILDGVVHVDMADEDLRRLERFRETEGG